MNDAHDPCPNCGTNLNGELIWQTFFDQHRDAERADEQADHYGATRTKGRWRNTMTRTGGKRSQTFCGKCEKELL